jgi:rhodanese-related sulfurtransferase
MKSAVKRIALLAAALALCSSAALAQEPSFRRIEAEDLRLLMEQKTPLTVVDARTPSEYQQGHIPGAISVGPDQYPFIAGFLPPDKTRLLVFYCRGVT